jgi:hypothetical protein
MYVGSAGTAPQSGGAFSPIFPTHKGNVCAELCSIFISAPLRIVSLLPAFLACILLSFLMDRISFTLVNALRINSSSCSASATAAEYRPFNFCWRKQTK